MPSHGSVGGTRFLDLVQDLKATYIAWYTAGALHEDVIYTVCFERLYTQTITPCSSQAQGKTWSGCVV